MRVPTEAKERPDVSAAAAKLLGFGRGRSLGGTILREMIEEGRP
jgi:hypothetical protein